MIKNLLSIVTIIIVISACGIRKQKLPEVEIIENKDKAPLTYKSTYTTSTDIINTKLELSFNWDSAFAYGKATILAKPYFYSTNKCTLQAKGFIINEILIVKGQEIEPLKYIYDNKNLIITLDRFYNKDQNYTIVIDYIAKPNKLQVTGSQAIAADKGLYFINNDKKNPNKPVQLWTQGETESNSCWFPTLDGPQEKMTQDIYLTVNNKFTTLSNGSLEYSTDNGNGTRTDYWRQSLPHSTYLTMIAVGNFKVTKDEWRDMEVNYYMEPEFAPYASKIFGKTPSMIEFFSNKLGVDYPWDKYSQIVIRDFVAGAMENTGAVTFYDGMNIDNRQYLDDNGEDIISHELFHHWFGDLVTAESWANLPLNESFATYGEYLWREKAYGKNNADEHIRFDLESYINESANKQEKLIRYFNENPDSMFDSHSYAKGGRVLHMLRKEVGDEAFFASLKLYLEKNKFKTAEIHQLRIAFEEITGRDLNWFFDQWFLSSGHPDLDISYLFDEKDKAVRLTITQKQTNPKTPIYKLPIAVDLYVNEKVERRQIEITKQTETFTLICENVPQLVNVDAEKSLLCVKTQNHTLDEWIFQYLKAPNYLDRYEAINALSVASYKDDVLAKKLIAKALNDSSSSIARLALATIKNFTEEEKENVFETIQSLAINSPISRIRAASITVLNRDFKSKDLVGINKLAVSDSSYLVVAAGLAGVNLKNQEEAYQLAKKNETLLSEPIINIISEIYAEKGGKDEQQFFNSVLTKTSGFTAASVNEDYEKYLNRMDVNTTLAGVESIRNGYFYTSSKGAKRSFKKLLTSLQTSTGKRFKELTPQSAEQTALNSTLENRIKEVLAEMEII